MPSVISVEHLSKSYHLGQIGTGTFANDLKVWWAKARGKPNPLLRIGDTDHGNRQGGELWALRDVSFTVGQGEVLGIIGRNGAGKSTLLKILSRVTAPTSGRIRIRGRIASLLEVGTGFHPELTGRENVYLNGAILGMSRAEINRKFDEIMNFAEIEKFIDTPVKRYSSGMYVRLAFAVAAHLDPEILVVDEVLAVGDAEFQKKCLGKMDEVARGGRTVLFVSHNLSMIRKLCPQAILLKKGYLVSYDISENIISKYIESNNMDAQDYNDIQSILAQYSSDPVFKLLNIAVTQLGKNTVIVGNGEPIEIIFEYDVYETTLGLRIFFDLLGQNDELIFRSFNDIDAVSIPTVKAGRYISRAVIPANWLSPRPYYLRIHATIHNLRMLLPSGGLCLPLMVENSGISNKAYVGDPIRGLISPLIDWETKLLHEESQS